MNLLLVVFLAARSPDAAVRQTMQQYVSAWLAGDAAAVMSLLTDDSVLIPNEKPPYVGADAIRNYWFPPSGPAVKLTRFTTTVDQIITAADAATVRGTQVIEWTSNGESWRTQGNYLTVLRKTKAGWRIAIQMAGNTPAARIESH